MAPPPELLSDRERNSVAATLAASPRLVALLAYDHALVPTTPTPDLTATDDDLRELLGALGRICEVHVVSGRRRDTLERWLGDLPIALHAEHGLWSRPVPEASSGAVWTQEKDIDIPWKVELRALLSRFTSSCPGAILEEKTASFAWHYRMVEPDVAAAHLDEFRRALEGQARGLPVEIIEGDKVIEVRLADVSLASVVKRLALDRSGTAVLAVVGDPTDGDLLRAVPAGATTVVVGEEAASARYRLPDVDATRRFLREIVERRSHR